MILKVTAFLFLLTLALCAGISCWTKTNGKQLPGLSNVESKNIEDCLRQCLQRSDCNAVDWDNDTPLKCWIQKQAFAVSTSGLKTASSVTNYILDRNCYTSALGSVGTVTPGVDTTCWTVTPGYHVNGLTNVNKQSVTECLNECLSNTDCKAVDWDSSKDMKCFVQTNKDQSTFLLPWFYVTNYMLNRECLKALLLDGSA